MTADLASKAVFDFCYVRNVIEMAVRKDQKLWIDIPGDQPIAGSVGGVEKNPSLRGLNQIAIRLEDAAAKRFVNHEATVTGRQPRPLPLIVGKVDRAGPNLTSSKGLLDPDSQNWM